MAERIRVGVLVSGRGTNMVALSEYKRREARSYDLVLVASNVPEARALVVARRLGIPAWSLSSRGIEREAFDDRLDLALREADVEVVALAGYMRLLSGAFVDRWRGRILNIHPSLLPDYPGLDTHRRAIAAGETWVGCSVHLVTEDLDGGPVLAQARVRVRERESVEQLAERVLKEEHRLYPQTLDTFCARLRPGHVEIL